MAMAVPLAAAELHDDHKGTSCGAGYEGTWHFVNNQVKDGNFGDLYVLTDAGLFGPFASEKVLKSTQHWTITGASTLINAWTGEAPLPGTGSGKLVLSDYSCREVKKGD
jgi:hypothetical protein